jgi:hypothetical protein
MEKLTVQDLAMFIGCEIKHSQDLRDDEGILTPEKLAKLHTEDRIRFFKPILRPLSDITEEDIIECIKSFDKGLSDFPEFKIVGQDNSDWIYIEVGYEDTECCWRPSTQNMSVDIFKYLISKHYDVFNWLEKGLAIDRI